MLLVKKREPDFFSFADARNLHLRRTSFFRPLSKITLTLSHYQLSLINQGLSRYNFLTKLPNIAQKANIVSPMSFHLSGHYHDQSKKVLDKRKNYGTLRLSSVVLDNEADALPPCASTALVTIIVPKPYDARGNTKTPIDPRRLTLLGRDR
jgi:hypothetical protein